MMLGVVYAIRVLGVLSALCAAAPAQNDPAATRAESIERERANKARNLQPQDSPKPERAIEKWVENPLNKIFAAPNGFGVQFGGLAQGAGFSLGARYLRRDLLNENLTFEASLVGSIHKYWAATIRASLPRLANRRVGVDFIADHTDSPSLLYFGPGPHSGEDNETDYRLESTDFVTRLAWKPSVEHVLAGVLGGAHLINTGPGTAGDDASIQTRFGPQQAPGVDIQTNYATAGPFAIVDFRDSPGDPRQGTSVVADYLLFQDYEHSAFTFRRMDAQVEQYIPFLNKKRVFALRGRTQLIYPNGGNLVPFYMQPALGGGDDLRGFEQYRFHDNNSLLFSGEYRWEVSAALDVALFSDAGTVFPRPGLIGFRNMREDYGMGFRVKTRDAVVMRLDAAVSNEGFHVWLRFGNAFPLFPYLRR